MIFKLLTSKSIAAITVAATVLLNKITIILETSTGQVLARKNRHFTLSLLFIVNLQTV